MAASNYAVCLDRLLEHEGGYVNHPDDPGGRTNKGITQRVYEKYLERSVTKQEIKDIPIEHVSDIYRENYWNRVSANDLPSGVDFCMFDWAVNSGIRRPSRALQKTVGAKMDGKIGPKTIGLVFECDPEAIIEEIYAVREVFYHNLPRFDVFGNGWIRRNEETREFSLHLNENKTLYS